MNLYTKVLNAIKIVNDPREDALDRLLKVLLDEQLTANFPVNGNQEQT
jgi:hypothetical protein